MKTLSALRVLSIALACLACVACKAGDESEDGGVDGGVVAPPAGGATGGTSSGGTRAPAGGSSGAGGAATSGSVAPGDDAGVGSCMAVCEVGEHCELVEVQCIRAPCPAQPTCVADQTHGGGAPQGKVDCDPRKITCKRAPPTCGELEAPSVDGSCFGPCVGIDECPCTGPEQCPDADQYTCHMSAMHCTPYL